MKSDLYYVKFDPKDHHADGGGEDVHFIVELMRKETGCGGDNCQH